MDRDGEPRAVDKRSGEQISMRCRSVGGRLKAGVIPDKGPDDVISISRADWLQLE